MRAGSILIPVVWAAATAAAQSPPAYHHATLSCAAFLEQVRTEVRAQRGGPPYDEGGGRIGILLIRTEGDAPLQLTAWYDSLVVWYDGVSGRVTPDTDGLIGGRWEGTITPTGEVALTARPFIPPDLRAVSDLSDALLDFFPPLASVAIPTGSRWTDSLGLEIARLADSAAAAGPVQRYRWKIGSRSEPPMPGDSTARLRQTASDEGTLAWLSGVGPLGWRREVAIETEVVGPAVRLPYRGRVVQRIQVTRITDHPACR